MNRVSIIVSIRPDNPLVKTATGVSAVHLEKPWEKRKLYDCFHKALTKALGIFRENAGAPEKPPAEQLSLLAEKPRRK